MQQRSNTRPVLGYALFDFAKKGFVLIFHAFLFPLYFKTVLLRGDSAADAKWGTMYAISVAAAMLIAPIVGSLADHFGRRLVFAILAVSSFAASIFIAASIGGPRVLICSAFIIANGLYYLTSNIYDSLLVQVSAPSDRVVVSGRSWGFGYFGGVCCFAVVYSVFRLSGLTSRWPFLVASAFYSVVGLLALGMMWSFLGGSNRSPSISLVSMIRRLGGNRAILLLGYWLIAEVIGTVVFFTAIYASHELRLTTASIGLLFLTVQVVAVPATWLVAKFARRFGVNLTLVICGVIWLIILSLLSFHVPLGGLIAASVLTSFVIGSTQSLMRAQFSLTLDGERTSETFGWYSVSTESSAIVGPLLFGLTSVAVGSERVAMASLGLPLCLGLVIVVWMTASGEGKLNARV